MFINFAVKCNITSMFDRRLKSYRLVGKTPVECSLEESTLDDKQIELDFFDGVTVSTVFLPFDHSFDDDSEPILFETMIFGGKYDGYQYRYHTYDESVEGHKDACYLINKTSIDRNNKLDNLGI